MTVCLPGSGEDSGEVHHGDHGQVPGAQQTLDGLQLFVEEVENRLLPVLLPEPAPAEGEEETEPEERRQEESGQQH